MIMMMMMVMVMMMMIKFSVGHASLHNTDQLLHSPLVKSQTELLLWHLKILWPSLC